jgi:Fe-S cluster biogenesis protein NfuA
MHPDAPNGILDDPVLTRCASSGFGYFWNRPDLLPRQCLLRPSQKKFIISFMLARCFHGFGALSSLAAVRFVKYAAPEVYRSVERVLEDRVRPAIRLDGGDIELHEIIDGVMIVTLTGACQGCPSRKGTLHNGVLGTVQQEVPQVVGIREKLDFEEL